MEDPHRDPGQLLADLLPVADRVVVAERDEPAAGGDLLDTALDELLDVERAGSWRSWIAIMNTLSLRDLRPSGRSIPHAAHSSGADLVQVLFDVHQAGDADHGIPVGQQIGDRPAGRKQHGTGKKSDTRNRSGHCPTRPWTTSALINQVNGSKVK